MKQAAGAIVVALGISALTCGGSNKPSLTPVALDDFTAGATAAECDFFVRCHLMSDVEICGAYLTNQFGTPTFQSIAAIIAEARADKIAYDPITAGACLDYVRRADCNQAVPNVVVQCAGAFKGTVADGGRCIADAACSGPTSFCADAGGDPATTVCNGICTPSPGSTCRNDAQCPSNQVCTPKDGITKCDDIVAPGSLDQPCGSHLSCQNGLHCEPVVSSTGTLEYICKAAAHLGEACTNGSGTCDDGLICVVADDRSGSTCMTYAALGDSCEAYFQCGGVLLSSIGCDPATHTCVALPSTGPCLASRLEGCNLLDSSCDMAQTPPACVPIAGIGETCADPLSCGLFTGASCTATAAGSTCTIPTNILCTP